MNTPFQVVCGHCSHKFWTRDKEKRFCNDVCKTRHVLHERFPGCKKGENLPSKGRFLRHCHHCQGWFKTDHSEYSFCDGICAMSSGYYKEDLHKEKVCHCCGSKFKGTSTKFCSEDCSRSVQKKRAAKELEKKRIESLGKEKKKRKKVSYDELNRRAELKRLEDEWKSLTR